MKIIINAFQYSSDVTGTDRMAHSFLTELQKQDLANTYIVICSNESYNRSSIKGQNFRVISPLQIGNVRILQRIYNKLWRTVLPYRLRAYRADCYFSFHNMNLPAFRVAKRMVVFNLDLIPIVLPGYESIHKKKKSELLKDYKNTVGKTDHFISISNFSKEELCSLLEVSGEKVSVIPLAVSPSFGVNTKLNREFLTPKKYILTIGGTEPRKNVETVVKAFSELPVKLQQEFPLVILGGEWHGINLDKFKNVPNVHCLGYVSEGELPGLYKNSKVFVFASEYEGFGFTILEAMSCGVPVVSSNSSSLSEVAANAALLFDPHDTATLAIHIQTVLTDQKTESRLIELGNKRVDDFSWETSTKKLLFVITGTKPSS